MGMREVQCLLEDLGTSILRVSFVCLCIYKWCVATLLVEESWVYFPGEIHCLLELEKFYQVSVQV